MCEWYNHLWEMTVCGPSLGGNVYLTHIHILESYLPHIHILECLADKIVCVSVIAYSNTLKVLIHHKHILMCLVQFISTLSSKAKLLTG